MPSWRADLGRVGPLAQLVEQRTFNPLVTGSNTVRPPRTSAFSGRKIKHLREIVVLFFFVRRTCFGVKNWPLPEICRNGTIQTKRTQLLAWESGWHTSVNAAPTGVPKSASAGTNQIYRTFDTKQQARDWAQRVEAEISLNIFIDRSEAERTTLGDALDRYAREIGPIKRYPNKN
jgi:hypothetical protein